MLLLKRATPATRSRLSIQSEEAANTISYDLDAANRRAKKLIQQNNSRKYLNERSRLLKNKNVTMRLDDPLEEEETKSVRSISSLRRQRQFQQDKERALKNRINFIELEKQRNLKTVEWARRKFSIMVERRTQNLNMKSLIEKVQSSVTQEKSIIELQNEEHVKKLQEKAQKQREEREKNVSNWRQQYQQQAKRFKQSNKSQLRQLQKLRDESILSNRHKAMQIKQRQFDGVSRKDILQKTKQTAVHTTRQSKLLEELSLKKQLFKRNSDLYSKLQNKALSIRRVSQRAKSELQKLEDIMSSQGSLRSRVSSHKHQSFFITKE